MEYITVRSGKETAYILPSEMEAIVMKPAIYPVPGGSGDILGISIYEGSLVAYYGICKITDCSCGIILRSGQKDGILRGIAAKTADMENIDEELLEERLPGVWGLKM